MYRLLLKECRKKAGIKTQKEMATRLDVTERTYAAWERGETQITLENAYRCAVLLGCTVNDLCAFPDSVQTGENKLVRLYRSANEQGKSAIMAIAENQAGDVARRAAPPGLESTA